MGTAPFWRWPPGTAAGAPPPGGGPMPPGAEGLILYGPEGCCWLGTDGTVQGEWPWEELVAVPEMAAEVMNWERLMFEPAWRDDLVWMGWTDESRSRNRLLTCLWAGCGRRSRGGVACHPGHLARGPGGGLHLL